MALSLALASLAMRPATAGAECIGPVRTAAGLFADYDVLLVGDVTEVVKTEAVWRFGFYQVTFNVLEAYKSVETGPLTLRIRGTAEDFRFEHSQRVLVFARRLTRDEENSAPAALPEHRPQYSVQCAPTKLVSLTDRDLAEFRRLARRR